jgi:hypothetical protein
MTDEQGEPMGAASPQHYLAGAEWFGDYVGYIPNATYPINVKLFGGLAVQDAVRLRDQLSQAIDRATSGEARPAVSSGMSGLDGTGSET